MGLAGARRRRRGARAPSCDIYRAGGAEVFVVAAGRAASSTSRRSGRSSGSSRPSGRDGRRPRRARPRRARRSKAATTERPRRPRRRPEAPQPPKPPTARRTLRRRPRSRRPTRPPAAADDARDRRPHAVPGDARGPARREHPGPDPRAGPRDVRVHDLREWGLGRHRTVDDYTYGGGAGMVLRPEPVAAALADAPPAGLDRDPARPGRRGVPPGPRRGPRDADPPRVPLPALRGRRRADPRAGRPRALDRRLRADRRRARGAGRHRRRPAAAPGRDRRGVDGRGVVRAGLLEYPQYTRPAEFGGHGRAGGPRLGDHGRSAAGVARQRDDPRRRRARVRTCSADRPRRAESPTSADRRLPDTAGPVLSSAARPRRNAPSPTAHPAAAAAHHEQGTAA